MQIERYQNKERHNRRTIAEHQWSVAKIAQMLALWEERLSSNDVDMEEVIARALLSGSVKMFTGEIQANTKYASAEMLQAVNEVNEMKYETEYSEMLPPEWVNLFKPWVIGAKDNTIEGQLVKAASIIDVLLECQEEIDMGNKRKFKAIFEENVARLDELDLMSIKLFKEQSLPLFYEKEPNVKIHPFSPEGEFRDTFFNYIYEIRSMMAIKRYQNCHRHKKRSVAEHEWSVSLISLCMGLIEKEAGKPVDFSKLLQTTLSHDDIEMFSGDILSNTKRTTNNLSKAIESIEHLQFYEQYQSLVPLAWVPDFKNYVLNPKDGSLEGNILATADVVDTIFESIEEIRLGNTEEFEGILASSMNKLFEIMEAGKTAKGTEGKKIRNKASKRL